MYGEQNGENRALFIVLLIVTAAGPLPLCSHMHRSKEKGAHIEKKKHTLSTLFVHVAAAHTRCSHAHTHTQSATEELRHVA